MIDCVITRADYILYIVSVLDFTQSFMGTALFK